MLRKLGEHIKTLAGTLTATGRWHQFAPFTALHLVTVTICLAAITALVLVGRTLPNRLERQFRLAMAVFAIAEWTIYKKKCHFQTRCCTPTPLVSAVPSAAQPSVLYRGPSCREMQLSPLAARGIR